jgi:hypothetical protein
MCEAEARFTPMGLKAIQNLLTCLKVMCEAEARFTLMGLKAILLPVWR